MSSGLDFIVIGASLGGLEALRQIIAKLPARFSLPMAVVLHRGSDSSGEMLVHLMQQGTVARIAEAEDKMRIEQGVIYTAPAGYHLLVEDNHLVLSTDAPVLYARPSIDVLFESAAWVFRERLAGIVLTGASADGTQGLKEIKRCGGLTIVQDPTTAEADTMPLAALASGVADKVMTLDEISNFLAEQDVTVRRWPEPTTRGGQ